MRGIPVHCRTQTCHAGITPAHAGNTSSVYPFATETRDHPRACGEYSDRDRAELAFIGSPPRMRGILRMFLPVSSLMGITPAHAGNTAEHNMSDNGVQDHPRACGEYCFDLFGRVSATGSPPRMRGIL